jgi:phosphotransferase system HPr (HPr) family protein
MLSKNRRTFFPTSSGEMTQTLNPSLQYEFSCPLTSGLHARPASHLAEVANRFLSDCSVTNFRNGLVANAKSVLGVIAADIRYQDRCVLFVSGSDEHLAQSALKQFLEKNLPRCDVPLAEFPAADLDGAVPRTLQAAHTAYISGMPVSRGISHG